MSSNPRLKKRGMFLTISIAFCLAGSVFCQTVDKAIENPDPSFTGCWPDVPLPPVSFIIQTQGSYRQSDELMVNHAPKPDCDSPAQILLEAPESGICEGQVHVAIVSNGLEEKGGVKGWSFSFSVSGTAKLVDATAAGTVAALIENGGIRHEYPYGFEQIDLVQGTCPGDRDGVALGVILSARTNTSLIPTGTATVLTLTFEGEAGDSAELNFIDGCQGPGLPVPNVAIVDNQSVGLEKIYAPNTQISFSSTSQNFVRGDTNTDHTINIADVVFILSYLFSGANASSCPDAVDTNDSGQIDISDAVALLSHLFSNGGDLLPPFEACGADPTKDDLECENYEPCE